MVVTNASTLRKREGAGSPAPRPLRDGQLDPRPPIGGALQRPVGVVDPPVRVVGDEPVPAPGVRYPGPGRPLRLGQAVDDGLDRRGEVESVPYRWPAGVVRD